MQMCVCLCACVCACVRACVRACVHVLDGEGRRVFASSAQIVLTAVYLTGYSDYLIGFREPLSPP